MSDGELVEVYRARDTTHAHLLRTQLEEAGIPTFIEGSQLQAAVGGLPTGWAIAPRLVVVADQADHARHLLEQWEQHPPGGLDADLVEGTRPEDVPAADMLTAHEEACYEQAGSAGPPAAAGPSAATRPSGTTPPRGLLRNYGHFVGGFAVVWGIVSWAEWFAIPLLFPQRAGPVPYLDFALLSLGLLFGCLWLTLQLLFFPLPLSWRSRLIYAAFPFSYAVFFVATFLRELAESAAG